MRFHPSDGQNNGQDHHFSPHGGDKHPATGKGKAKKKKGSSGVLAPGERMIVEHSIWLTEALRLPMGLPRIPVRRVGDGGFASLLATRAGRYRAERWWDSTLQRVPD